MSNTPTYHIESKYEKDTYVFFVYTHADKKPVEE